MKFLSEQPEELSRRAHYEDEWKKNNGNMNSPDPPKENRDNLFLGSTATTFLQQFLTGQECPCTVQMSRMCHDWQSSPSQSLGHTQEQDAQKEEKRRRKRVLLPENKHVWDARKQEQSSSSSHKRAVSEEWDRPPEKFWRMDEWDVTLRQDVTATRGASSSSASRGPPMDVNRPGNEPQMSKQII